MDMMTWRRVGCRGGRDAPRPDGTEGPLPRLVDPRSICFEITESIQILTLGKVLSLGHFLNFYEN
jgi:hypothetical protein